jgi:hypothetical protein
MRRQGAAPQVTPNDPRDAPVAGGREVGIAIRYAKEWDIDPSASVRIDCGVVPDLDPVREHYRWWTCSGGRGWLKLGPISFGWTDVFGLEVFALCRFRLWPWHPLTDRRGARR